MKYCPWENIYLKSMLDTSCFNTKIFQILYTGSQHCANVKEIFTTPVNKEKVKDRRKNRLNFHKNVSTNFD